MIPKYRICEEKIPRTQNMRRKDTQNTEYAKKRYPEHRIAMILLFRE
jgi:hypothetical protein